MLLSSICDFCKTASEKQPKNERENLAIKSDAVLEEPHQIKTTVANKMKQSDFV